jgi:hypothetical protein
MEGARAPGPVPPPSNAELDKLASIAPPMTGAEYLTGTVLQSLWQELDGAFRCELNESKCAVEEFLKSLNPAWNLVGRVHFNLAENRNDEDAPFAFLATYTTRLSAHGKARHVPLGQALRTLIERYPKESRRKLSVRVCEAWQWRQANGALRDMVCRGLLLMLERAGQIALPPVSYVRHNPLSRRVPPQPVLIDTTPIEDPLRKLQPLEFEQVRRTAQEPLFNSLMEEHHYLGYEQPVGEHLKFLVRAQGRPIACLAWSSAPRHLGSRDRYIGWDAAARRSRIRFIAYNSRFLILPWLRVDHLASHILGRMAARISDDWEKLYGHPIYFLETFIDPERFRGTCYGAANWVLMGRTTGRGKQSNSYVPNRSIKEVLGYPLTKHFRELLGGAA